jgi:hypothetical protein
MQGGRAERGLGARNDEAAPTKPRLSRDLAPSKCCALAYGLDWTPINESTRKTKSALSEAVAATMTETYSL